MTGPYDGVHLFVFRYAAEEEGSPPDEIVAALQPLTNTQEGPVFFTHAFTPFDDDGFVFLAHSGKDTLEAQSDFYNNELWEAGVRTDTVTELKYHRKGELPMGVKRNSPQFCGIARVRVSDRPLSVLDRIAKDFGEELPFVGASHTTGPWPVVVELGAGTFEDLEAALNELPQVSGVKAVQRSWTELGGQQQA